MRVVKSRLTKDVLALLLALPVMASAPAQAASSAKVETISTVIDDYWAWYLRQNPLLATSIGERRYDNALPDISLKAQDRATEEAGGFLKRLDAVPDQDLSAVDRTDKAILHRMLSEQIEANRFPERMILFSTYSSWHQQFADMADSLPFRAKADYESYLARLAQYPALNGQVIAISRQAIAKHLALPCAVLGNFEPTISGLIVTDPAASRIYAPFAGNPPADVSPAEWAAMQDRARTIIGTVINPENRKLLDFYRKDYLPKCRATVGISALPQGAGYYALQARIMTTTDLTPDAIHALGLSEVKRIRAEMDALATRSGYPSREAFIAKLRSDPAYYAKTPQELMAAAALTAKTIDGKMPRYFGRLPRLPYGIRAIPAETAEGNTTAYYMPGNPESSLAGTFFVNTSKLDQRPLWELPALTLHEAVPGHHNQIALQQEMELRPFRKYATGFTAFVEGWALYAESLGTEMGMYDTPEKTMGRLSYEMWRVCRLVVDTGLHSKGWTKAQAIAFMKENSALTDANIEAEVNRYISWPGQALAYKLGELKIRELRARAEKALGPRFDIRVFHDAVLGQGPVPLDVLERQIDDWIAAEKAKPTS